jgi:mRNA-degrading endonuclease RelE of RelBE toxin-antitoxin system
VILCYSQESRLQIRALAPDVKAGIRKLCEELVADPYQGKPLQRELIGFWTARFKRYRVIYRPLPESNTIHVYHVGLRASIYQEFGGR